LPPELTAKPRDSTGHFQQRRDFCRPRAAADHLTLSYSYSQSGRFCSRLPANVTRRFRCLADVNMLDEYLLIAALPAFQPVEFFTL